MLILMGTGITSAPQRNALTPPCPSTAHQAACGGWTHISGEMRLGELPKMQGAACAKAGLGLCSEMCYLHTTQEHPEPALPSLGEVATR